MTDKDFDMSNEEIERNFNFFNNMTCSIVKLELLSSEDFVDKLWKNRPLSSTQQLRNYHWLCANLTHGI